MKIQEDTSDIFESENDADKASKTTLVSRNITVMGRRTSVRLEPEMWAALREIASREVCTSHDICTLIAMRKNCDTSLTAAIRVFLMLYFRAACSEDGHQRAGHGNFEYMKRRARISEEFDSYFANGKRRFAANVDKPFSAGTMQGSGRSGASGISEEVSRAQA
ncbi:MAG: ribbon-helix-helix domain-containing protein [Alphaproteobacteria bacterium]|nr:ribbon-helix-helix domain-containing protein [Alphaproteobacteria bacterium]